MKISNRHETGLIFTKINITKINIIDLSLSNDDMDIPPKHIVFFLIPEKYIPTS